MFNTTLIVIKAFIRELRAMYERTYTILEPNYPGILSSLLLKTLRLAMPPTTVLITP
jgi:hypothetical protein